MNSDAAVLQQPNLVLAVRPKQNLDMYVVAAIITILLFLRDVSGINISKYILLMIIGMYILLKDIDKLICFICFLMPLYVGLPGNFITGLILARLIISSISRPQLIRINLLQFVVAVALSLFIFMQNLILGYTEVYHIIYSVEIFVVLFMLSYKGILDKKQCIFMYVTGVAIVGIIMLFGSLKTYTLSQLLSSASRLGTAVTTNSITGMCTHVDPNYYGYFCITALSCGWILLCSDWANIKKTALMIMLISTVFISFIGLSRAFSIVLILWIFIICLVQKGKSRVVCLIVIASLFVASIIIVNPKIFSTIADRFRGVDIIGANGRSCLFSKWYEEWTASFLTMMFGVGLYCTNVHSMQAQYLFGTGIVGTMLISGFALSFISLQRKKYKKVRIESYMPMTVIFIMAGTIPVAQSLTFMFPAVMGFYAYQLSNEVK